MKIFLVENLEEKDPNKAFVYWSSISMLCLYTHWDFLLLLQFCKYYHANLIKQYKLYRVVQKKLYPLWVAIFTSMSMIFVHCCYILWKLWLLTNNDKNIVGLAYIVMKYGYLKRTHAKLSCPRKLSGHFS